MADRDNTGKWVKGSASPNPGGRPAKLAGVREAAQQFTEEAVVTLATIMRDDSAGASARAAAAVALLDRGWGRPAASVDLTVNHSVSSQAAQVLLELSHRAKERRAEETLIIDAEELPTRQ